MTSPEPIVRVNQLQQVMWVPLPDGVFFECRVSSFGHHAKGISRSKPRALAFALEELAKMVAADDLL